MQNIWLKCSVPSASQLNDCLGTRSKASSWIYASLYTAGRLESAETSHFDGGSCHCYIWNLLGA